MSLTQASGTLLGRLLLGCAGRGWQPGAAGTAPTAVACPPLAPPLALMPPFPRFPSFLLLVLSLQDGYITFKEFLASLVDWNKVNGGPRAAQNSGGAAAEWDRTAQRER